LWVAVDVSHELKIRKPAMDNYEQNENNENQNEPQPPKFDPAAETKQKIIFFIVAMIVLVAMKFLAG